MSDLPAKNEIEVTLFGPGYGESCLVHLGHAEWLIVDSCVDRSTGAPAAIQYLYEIGANPATDVKAVFVSHYHDDHIRGISECLRECKNARYFTSTAIQAQTFHEVVRSQYQRLRGESGVKETALIFDILRERMKCGGPTPTFAHHDQRLLVGRRRPEYSVWALSPSSAQFEKGLLELDRYYKSESPTMRMQASNSNDFSLVLWIKTAAGVILLGGDLEETNDDHCGWSAILDSTVRPQEAASVFKIPHHGSRTAHNDVVWSKMLRKNPLSMLCPFTKSVSPPPTPDDISRILSFTEECYATAIPKKSQSKTRRDTAVQRQLREMGVKLREAEPSMGMIQARRSRTAQGWTVKCKGNACHLAAA